jgi:nuclear transcription Y subunit beta
MHAHAQGETEELREQDRFLPIANISRIMKKSLPDSAKIAKDAKETVQECVSEFICFITSEASDKCQQEKRKTINGEDILWAMSTLGFDKYVEPLKLYLAKYRESVKGEKPEKKSRTSDDGAGGGGSAGAAANTAQYAAAMAAAQVAAQGGDAAAQAAAAAAAAAAQGGR